MAGGQLARALVAGFWVVVFAIYLTHSIVLSSDSINNHVHVWYIARDLWHHARLPWHMPILAHGEAYAYPYGFLNWTTAALLWPLFGNWAVTLWTAIGTAGCLAGTFAAFPELRAGWWAAGALANPAIIEGLLFGQQTFVWASALLLFGIALWRRGHRGWAAVVVGLAQATHPAIVLPIALLLVLVYLVFKHDRGALVRWYALSCAMTLPAIWLALAAPTNGDISGGERIVDFWGTLGPRVLVVALPLLYTVLRRTGVRALAPAALLISIAFSVAFEMPLNVGAQWSALVHHGADTAALDSYVRSPDFVPGATYRVLRAGEGHLELYHVLRAGGRLDSEMFPESQALHNFDSVAAYAAALCERRVDQVLDEDRYDRVSRTNEHTLLEALADGAPASVRIERITSTPGFRAYRVDRSGCP